MAMSSHKLRKVKTIIDPKCCIVIKNIDIVIIDRFCRFFSPATTTKVVQEVRDRRSRKENLFFVVNVLLRS